MVKVWRIENEKGMGPYWNIPIALEKDLARNYPKHWNGTPQRPSPWREFQRDQKRTEFCGFLTMAQAVRWFTKKQRAILEAHGYHLVQVLASEITAGNRKSCQVLFVR